MRNDPLNADLLGKADAIAEKLAGLKAEAAAARALALRAQADEAISRAELTAALTEALIARAEAEKRRRAVVADRLLERRAPPTGRPRWLGALMAKRPVAEDHGLRSHPLFDARHYLGHGPELAAGEDAVAHYLRLGWSQGLSPHPLFDPAWYGRQAPAAAGPLLLHYLSEGGRAGLSPHPLVDPAWYLAQYPDVAAWEPLSHFVAAGAAEGRSPGPWFDLPAYVAARGPALAPDANPLVDYLEGGAWAIAEVRPGLSTTAYLATRPELVREALTPLEHWARQRQP